MKAVWFYLILIIMGYALGTINPSYLFGKLHGFDIRKRGSGNAGASNAIITMGPLVGVVGMIFDIAKAMVPVLVLRHLYPDYMLLPEAVGMAVILGHIFPFYMDFKGGKGLAALGGMILALDWRLFLILLGIEFVVLMVTQYLFFVPLTAAFVFPAIWGIINHSVWYGVVFLPLTVAMVYRHWGNIIKTIHGQELRISFLWNKDKEMQRITDNGATEGGIAPDVADETAETSDN